MSTAIILAGGRGTRAEQTRPKQFVEVCGAPVIIHTLRVFEAHPDISRIIVVGMEEWLDYIERECRTHGISKVQRIVSAGATSHDSLMNGIVMASQGLNIDDDECIVVHESVRPFVTSEMISDGLATCRERGNAITAVTGNEALLQSEDGVASSQSFARETMYMAQMPQFFKLGELIEAFREAQERCIKAQSLNQLMVQLGHLPLYISRGSLSNIKLTNPEDMEMLEYRLRKR